MRKLLLLSAFALPACTNPNWTPQQQQQFYGSLMQGQPSPYKQSFVQQLGAASNSANGVPQQQQFYSPVNPIVQCSTIQQGQFQNTRCY